MPKFYLNFRRVDGIAKDEVGIDLNSLNEAREAALLSLRELLAENIHAGSRTPVMAVIITDESGRELMTISSNDVWPEQLKTERTEEQIRIRAYQLWEEAGRPEGRADEFWHAAERELRNRR